MNDFEFDNMLSVDDNIKAFLVHLDSVNPDYSAILRGKIDEMKQASESNDRMTIRTQINSEIRDRMQKSGTKNKEGNP